MSNFYIYIDKDLGALPTGITIISLKDEPNDWIQNYPTNSEQIGEYLDFLELGGVIDYIHDFIPVDLINTIGFEKVTRSYLERLIPELIIKTKQNPEFIYRPEHCPTSYYYPCYIIPQNIPNIYAGIFMAKWVNYFKRKWSIETLWHVRHPEYNWIENDGACTIDHALSCLENCVLKDFHYKSFIKDLSKYWYNALNDFDLRAVFGRDYTLRKNRVWFEYFMADVGFFDCLSNEESNHLLLMAHGVSKHRDGYMFNNFIKKYKPINSGTQKKS